MACPPHEPSSVSIRKKKAVGGAIVFVRQCFDCYAQVGGSVPISRVPNPAVVEWFIHHHQPQPNSKRREYLARFKKPDWKRLRSQVLERDGYECQSCGAAATEVHHLTYERFESERLSDLTASCRECNMLEREQRITRGVLGV